MSLTSKEAFARIPQKLHNFFIKYPPRPFAQYSEKPTTVDASDFNPFLPSKNSETGRWRGPKYSLRRSADLFKLAKKYGLNEMLPPVPHRKFHEDKFYDKNWMDGVINPRGTKAQKSRPAKLKAQEEAIAKMDETIAAVRPSYKKQIARREEEKKTWY